MWRIPLGIALALLTVIAWWRRHRETASLRRCAQTRRLRFARYDVLDVHRRYFGRVLMRVGHSPRSRNLLHGTLEQGAWLGFVDSLEVGFGADRIPLCRCIAAVEMPVGVEAVWVPTDAAGGADLLRTAMGYLKYTPAGNGRGDRAHTLWVRRPSAAESAAVRSLSEAIAAYPAHWTWEAGEDVLLAARLMRPGEAESDALGAMLDAVAVVASRLIRVEVRSQQ